MTEQKFLGTGWQFPPRFNASNGKVFMSHGEQDIQDSLKVLLGTTEGERFMVPTYGLNLQEQLFESYNVTARNLLKDKIKRTLLVYEPRINILAIELDENVIFAGTLFIQIDYVVRASNSRFNLVYPYYLHDGTEVSPRV
jgi:hypothetical protein